jgi:hypothetical protein
MTYNEYMALSHVAKCGEHRRLRDAIKRDYQRLNRQVFNPYDAMRRALRKNEQAWHFGIELIQSKYSCTTIYYLNTGETYNMTILAYYSKSRVIFKIGNWGDLVDSGRYEV